MGSSGSCRKQLQTKKFRTASLQLSKKSSIEQRVEQKYIDLTKTLGENPSLKNKEIFKCSDCGKFLSSKTSFIHHKQDLLCVRQDDPSAQKPGGVFQGSSGSCRKQLQTKKFRTASLQLSKKSSIEQRVEQKYIDLTKTLGEKPSLKNKEIFKCSDCGKFLSSKTSFIHHKQDLLCVRQDDPSAQKPGGVFQGSSGSCRKQLQTKKFRTASLQLSKISSLEQRVEQKCIDLTKTLGEKPSLKNKEIFKCSDCGKFLSSKTSFIHHKQDLLCVRQDDPSAQKPGCTFTNSIKIPQKDKCVTQTTNWGVKSDDRIFNVNEKHLTSDTGLCKIQSKALLPSIYKKDPNTGIYSLTNEISVDTSVFSQLLNKNKRNVNMHAPNKKQNPIEHKHSHDEKICLNKVTVCTVCELTFTSESSYLNHKVNSCFKKIRPRALNFQCDICGKLFPGQLKLDYHRNTHTNAKPFQCWDCDKRFNSVNTRNLHHENTHQKLAKDKKHLCCFCGMITPSMEHLKAHEETHRLPEGASVPMPFKCLHCRKGFISSFKLRHHLKEHFRYRCTQCSGKYATQESLDKHKASHKMNEEFKCPICSKSFSKRQNLNIHKRNVHVVTTNKFFCDICEKGFKQKHHIEQHMISHSDERPISCPQCDETFKRKTHLKQHIAAFHEKGRKS